MVLVAGLSVTAWAYFTGRFGIGPLSAKDKEAVTAIADGVEAPEWADSGDRECAADELVRDTRSAELEKRDLIKADGDGWTYTGKWRYQEATTYVEALLDCSDDWAEKVGEEWELDDTDCLADIDDSTMADFYVAETLELSEGKDEADEGREEAVDALDECYVSDPPEPSAKARPAYRAVNFRFAALGSDAGRAVLMVRDLGAWKPLRRIQSLRRHRGGRGARVRRGPRRGFVPVGHDGQHRQALLREGGTGQDLVGQGEELHLHGGLHHLEPDVRRIQVLRHPDRPAERERRRLQLRERPVHLPVRHGRDRKGPRGRVVGLPRLQRAVRGTYPQDDRPTARLVSGDSLSE